MDDIQLSQYGRLSTEPAPVARMMAEFASDLRDEVDINLGVGYVNEGTIPIDRIKRATGEVLDDDRFRQPLNYGGPSGSALLVAAIRRWVIANAGGAVTKEQLDRRRILIGPNGATSLLFALAQVTGPGIVVTADPTYYIYANVLRRQGFELLPIAEDDHGPRVDLLEAELDRLGERVDEIRYLYFVTVNNPTGTITTDARKAELVAVAERLSERLGRKVPLILDRAYEELVHDPAAAKPTPALTDDPMELVHEICTLSKILAPGLRIGYMIAPESPFTRALVQLTSDIGFSAAPINQAVAAWMLDNHVAAQVESVNAGYRRRARIAKAAIDEHLGPYLEHMTGGQAGFYFYLTFKDVQTHEESPVFRYLARRTGDPAVDGPADDPKPRVIYIPGSMCVAPEGRLVEVGKRQLRLSYGYEDPDRVVEGVRLIREAIEWAKG